MIIQRVPTEPYVNWQHPDGPVLYTKNGNPYWLTWGERIRLRLGLTTVEKLSASIPLDRLYRSYWT